MECINIHTKTNSIIKYDSYFFSRIFFLLFFEVGSHWKNPKAKWFEKSMGCWHCSDAFWQHLLYIWLAVPGKKTQRQNSRKSLWVACGHTFWWDYPYVWLAVTGKPQRQNSRKSLWVACGHAFLTTLSSGLCLLLQWTTIGCDWLNVGRMSPHFR